MASLLAVVGFATMAWAHAGMEMKVELKESGAPPAACRVQLLSVHKTEPRMCPWSQHLKVNAAPD